MEHAVHIDIWQVIKQGGEQAPCFMGTIKRSKKKNHDSESTESARARPNAILKREHLCQEVTDS